MNNMTKCKCEIYPCFEYLFRFEFFILGKRKICHTRFIYNKKSSKNICWVTKTKHSQMTDRVKVHVYQSQEKKNHSVVLTDWSSMESLLLITGKHTLSQNIHSLHPLNVNLSETGQKLLSFYHYCLFTLSFYFYFFRHQTWCVWLAFLIHLYAWMNEWHACVHALNALVVP